MKTSRIAGCDVRVFCGKESRQLMPNGHDLDPEALFWEPLDYEGDVVFAGPFKDNAALSASVELWIEREALG